MKLLDLTCPNCGAKLQVSPDDNSSVTCPYCNTTFVVDDEAVHVKYDNAKDAGYEFEKGRQAAQEEKKDSGSGGSSAVCPKCGGHDIQFQRETAGAKTEAAGFLNTKMKTDVQYHTVCLCKSCGYSWDPAVEAKKAADIAKAQQEYDSRKKFFLVVLWICFFPVMFTIWAVKSEKLDKTKKIVFIALVWALFIGLMIWGNHSDSASTTQTGTTTGAQTTSSTSAAAGGDAALFASDSTVNGFFVNYNKAADTPFSADEITKGNVSGKALAKKDDLTMEVQNAAGANLYVSIRTNQENEETTLYRAFRSSAMALDSQLSSTTSEYQVRMWVSIK